MRKWWNRTCKHHDSPRWLPTRPGFEALESRDLLSVVSPIERRPLPGFTGYTPAQILSVYGFDQLNLAQPGQGQTIAIVEAYQDPQIQSDVATFDAKFGLPALNLTVINDGAAGPDPTGGWQQETALDVEWAHVIAPYAGIVVVNATNDLADAAGVPEALLHSVAVAASQPNVHVVSMSWGFPEFPAEAQFDGYFAAPGITFVGASGDNGAPATWPTVSPNVVAVGGTTLQLDSAGNFVSETGWGNGLRSPARGGSGGGFSLFEPVPLYQQNISSSSVANTSGTRMNPDVAYVGDPNTGLTIYDRTNGGWAIVGGTSAGTPQWAALIALADQEGAAASPVQAPLGSVQTLAALYQRQADFYDITAGNNGYPSGLGYDLVTGLGTPQANLLVPALARATIVDQHFVTQVYQSLLGRAPDAGGLAAWSNALGRGVSRTALVVQIEQSPEYLSDQVAALYQKILHRPADAGGGSAFVNFLRNGGTLEQVQAVMAGSDEYFQTQAGAQVDGFLGALYADALNRPIDPSGQAGFEQALSAGMTRQQVAMAIFSSPEYLQDLVGSYYQTFLNRPADSGGLAGFVAAMQRGMTDQQVIAQLLASPEYFGGL